MIKFFRNIRKSLLQDGKTSKYFKYAIGEIILVVIGILIALQINNWNEQRKDNIKEMQIVKSLYNEFLENSNYTEERMEELAMFIEGSGKLLLTYCTEKHTDISADSLLTLVYQTFFGSPTYAPKVSTFNRIINNEEFNLIQHDSLKTLLNQYQSILDFTYTTNGSLLDFEKDFWEYAQDKFGGISFGKKSNFSIHKDLFANIPSSNPSFNSDDIVSDISFENQLTKYLLWYGYTMNRLTELQQHNKTIRGYIDKNYRF
jgi:hypothetical protein